MRYLLTLAALFMALPLLTIGTPATAGSNCSRNDVRLDGDLGGGGFDVPARLGTQGVAPNIGLSEQDCVNNNNDELRDSARQGAAVAASMDAYGWGEGLNVTLNGANVGMDDNGFAAGLVLGYQHEFADPGVIHSITGKVGGARSFDEGDIGASVGVSINFGTF